MINVVGVNLVLFLLSLVVLTLSGSALVRSGTRISRFLRVPEFTVGFFFMAIGTSLPELFVGIAAAIDKNPALSLGNVIGSNIANLSIVAGISILLARKIHIKTKEARHDSLVMIGISALPLTLMVAGRELSRTDGALLIVAFVAYYYHIFRRSRHYTKEFEENQLGRKEIVLSSFLFFASLIILFYSAEWTVAFGSVLARDLNFPPIMIGLFLIALGTSLPELAFSARAMMTGHQDMGMANLIGSNITNASLILGVTALIHPIQANFPLFVTSAIYMILISFVFTAFIESKRFTWIAGISLILLYISFILVEFYVKTL